MKTIGSLWISVLAICVVPAIAADQPAGDRSDMVLWYSQPGEKWLDAMPLGNGLMGAMVFGGIQEERIALNESSFWSGRPHDYDNPDANKYFPRIRDLVFAGKFQEAEKMADQHFFGVPAAQQAYQPLGDLTLSFAGASGASDYRRELDMQSGIATIRYHLADATFTRKVFISYPDRVMAIRITCDKPGRISLAAHFKSPYLDQITAKPGKLLMDGTWKGPIPVNNPLIAPVDGKGLRFQAALTATAEGGQSTAVNEGLDIRNANAVTLVETEATSFVNYHDISGDPAARCESTLTGVASMDFPTLRRRHEADFMGLMGRVHLHVGEESMNDKPTDQRLAAYRAGKRDTNLEALCFQFGRYILAASSRAGGQPANLQGIWDEAISPSWGSKYTININTEMNYWPAEVCNLAECEQPLFDMLKDISITGAKTAKVYYGISQGWVTHHNIDLWRRTAPVDAAKYGMWPVGGAWLCQNIWEHYAFSGDRAFLEAQYPIMKGAAQFLLALLVEEPKHHWLVTPFSMSPEHGYFDADGKPAVLSPGPTMDIAIMRELFPHCIQAARSLGIDEDFVIKLQAALAKLPPYQISKLGYLQEWIEDWKSGNQGHNVSPNFTFYPGRSITLRGQPELAEAIHKWMNAHPSRGGFIINWDTCIWARLERGDNVSSCIQTYMKNGPATNLHNRGANQSDASFGFTAGVAESLVQSHADEISLLPALPAGWTDGSVQGLRTRGGFLIDMRWKDGKLESTTIRDVTGGGTLTSRTLHLRSGSKKVELTIEPGKAIKLSGELSLLN